MKTKSGPHFASANQNEPVTLEAVLRALYRLGKYDEEELFDMISSGEFEEAFPYRLESDEDIDLGSFSELRAEDDALRSRIGEDLIVSEDGQQNITPESIEALVATIDAATKDFKPWMKDAYVDVLRVGRSEVLRDIRTLVNAIENGPDDPVATAPLPHSD